MSKIDDPFDFLAPRPNVSRQFVLERLPGLMSKGQSSWLLSNPSAHTKGRLPKTAMERLSIKTCYWWIRARCPQDWSDQRLSLELNDPTQEARSFERMRRSGVAPESIWRLLVPRSYEQDGDFHDQVVCDDFLKGIVARPEFAAFKETFSSSFWTILNRSTSTLFVVRTKLNEWMENNGFVRLEGGLNCLVDEQASEFENRLGGSGMIASQRLSYSQWLFFALNQLDKPFECLVLLGLLEREAMLLGHVERAYTIAKMIPGWIKRACPACSFANPIRQRQYEEYCREFQQVIYAYMLRGHIESSLEGELYPHGSDRAVQGYILDKQSGFLTGDKEEAFADWRSVQCWNMHEANAAISLAGLYLADRVESPRLY